MASYRSVVDTEEVVKSTLGACGIDLVRGHACQVVPRQLPDVPTLAVSAGRLEHWPRRGAALRGEVRLVVHEVFDGSGDGLPVHLAVIADLEPVEVDEPESVVRVRQPGCGSGPNLSLQDSFVRLGQRLGLNLPALLLLGVLLLAAFQLGLELLDLTPERAGLTLDLLLEVAVDLLELAGLGLPIRRLLGGVLVGLLGVVGSRLAGNSVVLRDLGRVSLSGRVRHQTVSPYGRLVKRPRALPARGQLRDGSENPAVQLQETLRIGPALGDIEDRLRHQPRRPQTTPRVLRIARAPHRLASPATPRHTLSRVLHVPAVHLRLVHRPRIPTAGPPRPIRVHELRRVAVELAVRLRVRTRPQRL